MKRDMALARRILLEVESWPFEKGGSIVEFEGIDPSVISYHVMLLDEAGLLKGTNASGGNDICWFADRLTWEGHEFVETARDETQWKKAVQMVGEKTGGLAFEVLKQVLVALARGAVEAALH